MMRALFLTTETNDTDSLVRAWDCWNDVPSVRIKFPYQGARSDAAIVAAAKEAKPDVIFYIGAHAGSGLPSIDTFKALRAIAPTIDLVCDAGDQPWHPVIEDYRAHDCFDLQVGLDGHAGAPVDLVTVTPVDPRPFDGPGPERDIACGFSGNFGRRGVRGAIVLPLVDAGLVKVRMRQTVGDGYSDHANFLRRCRVVLNTSFAGSARTHHIKGRVLEAGMAGAALLELTASPIADWFPPESYFTFADVADAPRALAEITPDLAAARAAMFGGIVRERYHPSKIYGEILSALK